jgi:hypothetical protein
MTEFSFDVHFGSGVTVELQEAFEKAKARWRKFIVGGLPTVVVDGVDVDGLRIDASIGQLDQLGQLGLYAVTKFEAEHFRPADDPKTAFLPAKAQIQFDEGRLAAISEADATAETKAQVLEDLVAHEIGHALGFSRDIWKLKGLIQPNVMTDSPVFSGSASKTAYGMLGGTNPSAGVPLDATGLENTFISHWSQAIFLTELMTFSVDLGSNPIGPVTIAALRDLGYEVSEREAETKKLSPGLVPSDLGGAPAGPGGAPAGPERPPVPVGAARPPAPSLRSRAPGPAGTLSDTVFIGKGMPLPRSIPIRCRVGLIGEIKEALRSIASS